METALAVMTERVMEFYGYRIISIQDGDGRIWVPLRPICDAIGLDFASQYKKIKSDPAFTCCDITTHDASGRKQKMFCLELDDMHAWFFTINPKKLREDIQAPFILFKQKSIRALRDFWTVGIAINSQKLPQLVQNDSVIQLTLGEYRSHMAEVVAMTVSAVTEIKFRSVEHAAQTMQLLGQLLGKVPDQQDRIYDRLEWFWDCFTEFNNRDTRLTDQLFTDLWMAKEFCWDKIILLYPLDVPNKKVFDSWRKRLDLPTRKQVAISPDVSQQILYDYCGQRLTTINPLILNYNYNGDKIKKEVDKLEKVFRENRTVGKVGRGTDYYNYTQFSPAWAAKQTALKKATGYKCFECGFSSPTCMNAHHRNYDRTGQELLFDLEILCSNCHTRRHQELERTGVSYFNNG